MESLLNHDHGGHTPHTRGPARPRVSETLRTVSPLAQSAPHSGDWIFPAVPVVAMGAGWSCESSSRSPLVRPSFSLNSSKVLPPRVPGDSALSPIGGDQGESEGGGGAAGGRVGVAQDARDEWAPRGNPFLSSGAGAISFSSGAISFSSGAGAIAFSAASKSGATPFFLAGAGAGATSFSLGLGLGLGLARLGLATSASSSAASGAAAFTAASGATSPSAGVSAFSPAHEARAELGPHGNDFFSAGAANAGRICQGAGAAKTLASARPNISPSKRSSPALPWCNLTNSFARGQCLPWGRYPSIRLASLATSADRTTHASHRWAAI